MIRCQRRVFFHDSNDVAVTDAAAQSLRSALFHPGHVARCDCSMGNCNRDACSKLHVFDRDGKHVATFHGRDWRAVDGEVGNVKGLTIFRQPASEHASTKDDSSLLHLSPDGERAGLRAMNEKNAEFWRPKEGTWLHQQQSK